MSIPSKYDYHRYLAAKQSVDNRALNRHVWERMAEFVKQASQEKPVRILEVGAGIGTMIARMLDWGLLQNAEYLALDVDGKKLSAARGRLAEWGKQQGYSVTDNATEILSIEAPGKNVTIEFLELDAHVLGSESEIQPADLVIANAFLDLVDVPAVLPGLFTILRTGGSFYFSINYDGEMFFSPEIDQELDETIFRLYHESMDTRAVNGHTSGDSHTGRNLYQHLLNAGAQVSAVGGSDWAVTAQDGKYHEDEAYFLHFILNTIQEQLQAHPSLDPNRFQSWLNTRHSQVENGSLFYFAHQLDYFGRIAATKM